MRVRRTEEEPTLFWGEKERARVVSSNGRRREEGRTCSTERDHVQKRGVR